MMNIWTLSLVLFVKHGKSDEVKDDEVGMEYSTHVEERRRAGFLCESQKERYH
jgi:hypothetical protein